MLCLVVNTKTETSETMQSEMSVINAHKIPLNKSNDLGLKTILSIDDTLTVLSLDNEKLNLKDIKELTNSEEFISYKVQSIFNVQ